MKISFLGGASEVGASCILVKINNKNILMDSGIRQGSATDVLPDFRTIQESGGVDAIVISHAHMDHIGSLPIIANAYPLAKIYCNNMTKDLMRVLLYDSLKIMNGREVEIPLYSESYVEDVLNRTYTYNFETPFKLLDGIKCTLYMAGHIPGAACVYLTSEHGSLFYSGDFSLFPQIAVEGAKFPKLRPDVAIIESTYGDKLHSSRKLEEDRLVELVAKVVASGGKVLVPAFALGRAQEVILILKKAINNGKIPKTKVYVDGMVRDINLVFKRNPLYLKNNLCKKILSNKEPFYDENIIAISKSDNTRQDVLKSDEACIIVSSSGMLTGGPSQFYAESLLGSEKATIIISGYQDEESPGRKLLNLYESTEEDRKFELNGRFIPVKCKIEKVSLSAHGDKSEIKAALERLNPKNIFLVHGDKNIIAHIGNELSEDANNKVYIPVVGDTYDINIYNPRKQFEKRFNFKMNCKELLKKENLEKLREFVINNYSDRGFTAEELLCIWGQENVDNLEISNYQKLFTDSIYFENDNRRLFMFYGTKESELQKYLQKKEITQIEVHDTVKEALNKFDLKKVSLMLDKKTVVVNFDFPKVLPSEINNIIKELEKELEWKIDIKQQTNYNALESLITQHIGYDIVDKISHNIGESKVTVKLSKEKDLTEIQKIIYKKTGFDLVSKGSPNNNSVNNNLNSDENISVNINVAKEDLLEQNLLAPLLDTRFKDSLYKPYKKSVMRIGHMKLLFISPEAGNKNAEIIEDISRDSGWIIEIGNSYNQNDILNITDAICRELNVELKKRPSFIPESRSVKIQSKYELDEETFNKIKKEVNIKACINVIM